MRVTVTTLINHRPSHQSQPLPSFFFFPSQTPAFEDLCPTQHFFSLLHRLQLSKSFVGSNIFPHRLQLSKIFVRFHSCTCCRRRNWHDSTFSRINLRIAIAIRVPEKQSLVKQSLVLFSKVFPKQKHKDHQQNKLKHKEIMKSSTSNNGDFMDIPVTAHLIDEVDTSRSQNWPMNSSMYLLQKLGGSITFMFKELSDLVMDPPNKWWVKRPLESKCCFESFNQGNMQKIRGSGKQHGKSKKAKKHVQALGGTKCLKNKLLRWS